LAPESLLFCLYREPPSEVSSSFMPTAEPPSPSFHASSRAFRPCSGAQQSLQVSSLCAYKEPLQVSSLRLQAAEPSGLQFGPLQQSLQVSQHGPPQQQSLLQDPCHPCRASGSHCPYNRALRPQ
jgi:hypothetical protein